MAYWVRDRVCESVEGCFTKFMTQSEPAIHTLPRPRSNVCPHPCDDVASVTVLCRTTGGGGTPGGGSVPLASK